MKHALQHASNPQHTCLVLLGSHNDIVPVQTFVWTLFLEKILTDVMKLLAMKPSLLPHHSFSMKLLLCQWKPSFHVLDGYRLQLH
eukprot:m.236019 g.236019  ORF g.236019 m.236019 type:complete len:85 (+) comp13918_c1_seq4:4488-4742(+)